jgi:hypothetical protein
MSRFFEELKAAYDAELDDLMTDSAGHDVLARRLQANGSGGAIAADDRMQPGNGGRRLPRRHAFCQSGSDA